MEETKPTPRVSVIVVSHNCVEALRRCLTALEASIERELIEVVVIDKGSRDGSAQIDAEFPQVQFLRLPRNFGRTKAWNIAVRTATAELLFFLSPFVEVRPETITKLVSRIDTEPTVGAICPLLVTAAGEHVSKRCPLPAPDQLYQYWKTDDLDIDQYGEPLEITGDPITVPYTGAAAILIRRNFLKGMNYFDDRYGEFGADWELAYQLKSANRRIELLADVTAVRHPAGQDLPPKAEAALSADFLSGAVIYASKRQGWFGGLRLRMSAILYGLSQLLFGFRNLGYQSSRFFALLGGQKIDGTQSGI